jgi:hypothetical protein
MAENVDRRNFLKKSVAVSTGAALGLSLEEKILLGQRVAKASAAERQTSGKGLPMGRIGKVKISRIICGGNLINGFAHASLPCCGTTSPMKRLWKHGRHARKMESTP